MPPPPPIMEFIMDPERSLKPRLLVLLALAITLIWLLSVKRPPMNAPCQRVSLTPLSEEGRSWPPPAIALPKIPFIMPFWTERSMIVSSSPSSMPVNSACSDFFLTTFTFSTSFAGMLLEASWGSSRKNVLPSMVILVMVSPLEVMEPSSATSMPGSFFSRSTSMLSSLILKEEALYSTVSFLMTMGLPTAETEAASRTSWSSSILMTPRFVAPFTSTSDEWLL